MKLKIHEYPKNNFRIAAKNLNLFVLGSLLAVVASCESSSTAADENAPNLEKIVTFSTNSSSATYNTKNIKHYVNNQIVSDSTFDYQNQFLYRSEVTMDGLTKVFKSYTNTGELSTHRVENYDAQGRLVGRHDYLPASALYFTYVYNDNGTVTSKYFNELDNTTTEFRTFTKNADGLLYKENGEYYSSATSQYIPYEAIATLDNQKLLSVNDNGVITSFQYYPNPKPANMLKTLNQLNNEIVKGNSLRYLAQYGNSYYKDNDADIVTFDSANYKTYFKSVYVNTTASPNVTSTTEQFYYYN